MRAKDNAYHIDCFRCIACHRQLIPGDEFALREDGLFCKADHDVVERASVKDENSDCESSPSTKSVSSVNNNNNNNNNNIEKTKNILNNNTIKSEKGLSNGKFVYDINDVMFLAITSLDVRKNKELIFHL